MNEWTPILDGDRIQEAWEVIESIAAELAERKSNEQLGAFALAERALFFRYLELARPGRGSEAIAERFVDAAIDEVAQTPLPPTLYGGFVGVSWILEHIAKSGSKILDEDPNQAIDSILAALLSRNQWRGDYDLIRGIVGVGVYASERETPDARACLDAVVGHLAATAEPVDGGVTWLTRPEWLLPTMRPHTPDGYYNVGVAHGVPAAIWLLARIASSSSSDARCRTLLDNAVAWVLAQRLSGQPGIFPTWIAPNITPAASRAAWCYGDPGVAGVLLAAARFVGETSWENAAIETALKSSQRPPEFTGVADAGLCHGAAGLGQIYGRLFHATGDARFGEAARFWFERTLALRQPGEGVAGYRAWGMVDMAANKHGWTNDFSFLTGIAGIGLALLGAVTPIEPRWDRLLLLS